PVGQAGGGALIFRRRRRDDAAGRWGGNLGAPFGRGSRRNRDPRSGGGFRGRIVWIRGHAAHRRQSAGIHHGGRRPFHLVGGRQSLRLLLRSAMPPLFGGGQAAGNAELG